MIEEFIFSESSKYKFIIDNLVRKLYNEIKTLIKNIDMNYKINMLLSKTKMKQV